MNRTLIFLTFFFTLASCTTQKQLYTWNDYSITSYNYLKNSDDKSVEGLIKTYQRIIDKQKGKRNIVPPGIYADYGFLLLQVDKISEGRAMLQKEIELYPESKIFIDRILKMTER